MTTKAPSKNETMVQHCITTWDADGKVVTADMAAMFKVPDHAADAAFRDARKLYMSANPGVYINHPTHRGGWAAGPTTDLNLILPGESMLYKGVNTSISNLAADLTVWLPIAVSMRSNKARSLVNTAGIADAAVEEALGAFTAVVLSKAL